MKIKDWYKKKDPPMWVAADFECMNVLFKSTSENDVRNAKCMQRVHDDLLEKLFPNEPVAIR